MEMKAAVLESPRRLVVKDVPEPVCGDNDVLLKIHRASICATDLMYYEALFPCPTYPIILGHECSGEIAEMGKNVRELREGDRVTFWGGGDFGGFAEYRTVRPGPSELFKSEDGFWYDKAQAVIKLSDTVSYEEGAILEVLCSAMRTIYASDLKPTDKVVVVGLGPGGLMLIQGAKALGASTVIGIDLEDFRLNKAKELGAGAVFNNSKMDNKTVKKKIWESFGEIDVVFDAMGNDLSRDKNARNLGLELLRPHGTYAMFGTPSEDQRINMALITSKGIQTTSATFDARYFSMEKTRELLALSERLVTNGSVKIKPLITHHIALEQAEEGLKLCKERKHEAIKIVIDVVP